MPDSLAPRAETRRVGHATSASRCPGHGRSRHRGRRPPDVFPAASTLTYKRTASHATALSIRPPCLPPTQASSCEQNLSLPSVFPLNINSLNALALSTTNVDSDVPAPFSEPAKPQDDVRGPDAVIRADTETMSAEVTLVQEGDQSSDSDSDSNSDSDSDSRQVSSRHTASETLLTVNPSSGSEDSGGWLPRGGNTAKTATGRPSMTPKDRKASLKPDGLPKDTTKTTATNSASTKGASTKQTTKNK